MPFNLDKLKQKKAECSVALVAAMKEQNEEKIEQALGDFAQYVGDAMSMAAEQHNGNAIDTVILATRGVRQLTQQETSFWEGFIQAAKASDVKQAINGLKDGIPVTFIDAVLDDVRKAHPLLNLINFRNGSMYTRFLYNKSGKPTIVWGDITSAITNELNADIGYIDVALKKLSAFMYVPKDMLVMKHNVRITMGLEKGEVKSLLSHSDLQNFLISEKDILTCIEGIFKTINAGLAYIIPDGVSIEEKDPDLAEIEREYGKVSDDIGVTRFYQRGYSSGLNYQEINITTPGEITQMWLLNISERQGR